MTTQRRRSRDRRSASSGRPRSYSELYKRDASVPTTSVDATAAVIQVDTIDWNKEYGYVFADLRRLLIVSAILFAIIIVAGILF
jgi:hypothetical protein